MAASVFARNHALAFGAKQASRPTVNAASRLPMISYRFVIISLLLSAVLRRAFLFALSEKFAAIVLKDVLHHLQHTHT